MTTPADESVESAKVYGETAAQYSEQIGTQISSAVETPLDRAIIWAFAEMVLAGPTGLVADLGCGPGRAAAFFAGQGLDAVGFDLAEGMVAVARAAHPHVRFEVAPLTEVPLDDGSLVAAACWYSIIHTPTDQLPAIWTELDRLLANEGQLLLAFQAGDGERIERTEVQGSRHMMINFRHDPAVVVASLEAQGFEVTSLTTRAAAATHEASPQAFVMARKP